MPLKALLEKDFIGRNQEIESLFNIHSEVKQGIASSIFLSGEPGVGKTELLRQLFQLLFWKQHDAVPFFYAVSPACASAYDFSMDYLKRFIRQWLSFQKKDIPLIYANGLSIEDLMSLAEKSEAHWAVEKMGNFLEAKRSADVTKIFLSAITAPYHSYLITGMPVIVMIDDFEKVKEFYTPNSENKNSLWMFLEESIKSRQTPHVLTGSQAELREMFFEKTSFGESLEFMHLSGLDKIASLRLFTSLCDDYGIKVGRESIFPLVDIFHGNPFYIRNFIQTARNKRKSLCGDDLWRLFVHEITNGKIYTYWISKLRKKMQRLDLRKASLEILNHLCSREAVSSPSTITTMFSIGMQDFNDIVNIFQTAGIMEMNFSSLKLIDDAILAGVIKGLYSREILEKPINTIKEELIKEYQGPLEAHVKTTETKLFDVTIPYMPRAELVAVNTLEHIAESQGIPKEVIGQMQLAIVDLFTNIIPEAIEHPEGNFDFTFKPDKDIFTIEIRTPYNELIFLSSPDIFAENQLIRRYIDDIKLEETTGGTKIILIKNLKKTLVPAT